MDKHNQRKITMTRDERYTAALDVMVTLNNHCDEEADIASVWELVMALLRNSRQILAKQDEAHSPSH
jgi:hypothetical protein